MDFGKAGFWMKIKRGSLLDASKPSQDSAFKCPICGSSRYPGFGVCFQEAYQAKKKGIFDLAPPPLSNSKDTHTSLLQHTAPPAPHAVLPLSKNQSRGPRWLTKERRGLRAPRSGSPRPTRRGGLGTAAPPPPGQQVSAASGPAGRQAHGATSWPLSPSQP